MKTLLKNLAMIFLPGCDCHGLHLPLLALSRWNIQLSHRCYYRQCCFGRLLRSFAECSIAIQKSMKIMPIQPIIPISFEEYKGCLALPSNKSHMKPACSTYWSFHNFLLKQTGWWAGEGGLGGEEVPALTPLFFNFQVKFVKLCNFIWNSSGSNLLWLVIVIGTWCFNTIRIILTGMLCQNLAFSSVCITF